MEEFSIKSYAHLGDAVYEVFIREKLMTVTSNLAKMHKINTSLVRASFQCQLIGVLDSYLTEYETDLIRRGRNIKTSSARKINQNLHRLATGFEVLIGYLHIHDRERLLYLFKLISDYIDSKDHLLI